MGPQFETPAEIRMAALLGADAVGMSTVPEPFWRAMPACGAGVVTITNLGGTEREPLSHAHTCGAGASRQLPACWRRRAAPQPARAKVLQ
jgi:purine-nucleoside phosphorylase